jgi:hypothetical protein
MQIFICQTYTESLSWKKVICGKSRWACDNTIGKLMEAVNIEFDIYLEKGFT